MFCPNCGAKVEEDQAYCTDCGAKLTPLSEPTHTAPPAPSKEVVLPSETTSETKTYSIKSLVMGIISCALAFIGILLVYNLTYRRISIVLFLYYVNRPNLFEFFIPLTCFIVGVVLGNLARKASNSAKILEAENYMEKIGKVLGIIGIVVNAVIMAFYIIDALLRILLGISLAGIIRGDLRYYY